MDFGKKWEIERCMVAEKGILAFHNARRFYPFAVRAAMETQKGRPVTRLSPRETSAKGSADAPFVEAGDYMASNRFGSAPNERLFSRCRVLAVDPHSTTVTLDSPSDRDFWGDCAVFVKGGSG